MIPTSSLTRLSHSRFMISLLSLFLISTYHRYVSVVASIDDGHRVEQNEPPIYQDMVEDSFFDPLQADPSCLQEGGEEDCGSPPDSTIETEPLLDASCLKGGPDYSDITGTHDPSQTTDQQCILKEKRGDQHWGSDPSVLDMRDQLRKQARQPLNDTRPPIFLLPGLASTRLVAWKFKKCRGVLGSDIRVQDNVWLNINLIIQMGTVNVQCMLECLRLGRNQSDTDDWETGCKLRPDEGLDAIASLAPGGIGSSLLVGGTNTVYSWLIQWLSDHLGYDVTNIIGLPYDWRLSPDKMEARDGFLSMTRRRIEAAVASNGGRAGIVVAHSMGNLVFRHFINWLRVQMREEAYHDYVSRARRREKRRKMAEDLRKQKEQLFMERAQRVKEHLERFQGHQQLQQGGETPPKEGLDNTVDPPPEESIPPGWMSAVGNAIAWFGSLAGEDESNDETETKSKDDILPDDEEEIDLSSPDTSADAQARDAQLRALATEEGDAKWVEWLETHIWTYIGLSAPMLGAVNPLRSVLSGENMGLPISDELARTMEVTFGSTHTLNPISIATGFCDDWNDNDWADNSEKSNTTQANKDLRLACLDDIAHDIDESSSNRDPWQNFTTLKSILRDRIDWDTLKPMVDVKVELCQGNGGKKTCTEKETLHFGPRDVENGHIFGAFNSLWREQGEPLKVKREQLEESFFNTDVANILNHTWERPLIKHVVMAYGTGIPTEVGYVYKKQYQLDADNKASSDTSGVPNLKYVLWEESDGRITVEAMDGSRGSLAEHFIKKKTKRVPYENNQTTYDRFRFAGDGSVPYQSLSWVHTWLLHAARARRFGEEPKKKYDDISSESTTTTTTTDRKNALDHIHISHRPRGKHEWVDGPPPLATEMLDLVKLVDIQDTGVNHPHGTRYKPLMTRYHNVGISRTTGIEYTTTVIEALGVEHKETTRNYDILAAVFSDALKFMHDDLGLV